MYPFYRRRGFYVFSLALPLATLAYLAASGNVAANADVFRAVSSGGFPSPEVLHRARIGSVLSAAAIIPLLFAAWDLGRHHTAARRRDYMMLVGLREVARRVFGRGPAIATPHKDLVTTPADRPGRALLIGLFVAVLVPAFFSSFSPDLRTPPALIWLGGAGLIMGSMAYARWRAMAYLREEPRLLDPFRPYRLLNTNRYEAPGRAFVIWQLIAIPLFMVWWLGGGSLLLWR